MVHYLAFIIRLIERKISKIKHLRLNQQSLIRNSLINRVFDEDLYQELVSEFLKAYEILQSDK
jgi:hypothetical protein